MAVNILSVTRPHPGCSASQKREGLRIVGDAVLVWQVEFDSGGTMAEKQIAALAASAGGVTVPAIGEAHPGGAEWFVIDKKSRPGLSPMSWLVDVTYRCEENPLSRYAEVVWDTVREPAIVEVDNDGKAVVSSAGEPFDPPIQETAIDLVGRINYAAATYDPLIVADYIDAVSSNAVTIDKAIFPAYTIKINEWKFTPAYWGQYFYYKVYLEIQIRLAYKPGTTTLYGWKKQIPNQGFYHRDAELHKIRILEKDLPENFGIDLAKLPNDGKNPIDSPVLLDSVGNILIPGHDPVLLYFKTKKERAFNFNLTWRT